LIVIGDAAAITTKDALTWLRTAHERLETSHPCDRRRPVGQDELDPAVMCPASLTGAAVVDTPSSTRCHASPWAYGIHDGSASTG
jgi:hypothetical protein